MTCGRRRRGLGLTHRRHVVPGRHRSRDGHVVTCGRRRSGLGLTHRRHVVPGRHRSHGGHAVTSGRRWDRLSLTHHRHVVPGRHCTHGGHVVTCGRRRSGLGLTHRRHVVPGRHRSHGGHVMTGVRIGCDRRRSLRHSAGRTHGCARHPGASRVRRWRTPANTAGGKHGRSLRGRGRGTVAGMSLRKDRPGRSGEKQRNETD